VSEYRIRSADFILGGYSLADLPESDQPEIAFLGRSNVGKSTLVNRLTGRKNLARVSSTPGRTQQINIFDVNALTATDRIVQFSLADLPGYGYAKFSKSRREVMSRLIVRYLQERASLRVVCLLNDSKRLPEADEIAIRSLCFENDISLLICMTKCDRLRNKDLQKQLTAISDAYGLMRDDVIITGEKTPATAIWNRIIPLLDSAK
jgi:GTP-binding protein